MDEQKPNKEEFEKAVFEMLLTSRKSEGLRLRRKTNMKEEFNLSEKIRMQDSETSDSLCYLEEDVKEFIRRLKNLYFIDNKVLFADIIIEIDKLAGDKLI